MIWGKSLDYLPAIKIARQLKIPFKIVARCVVGHRENTFHTLRQLARSDRMSASRAIHVAIRPLAFNRATLVHRLPLLVPLIFPREPFVLLNQLCKMRQDFCQRQGRVRPCSSRDAFWHADVPTPQQNS